MTTFYITVIIPLQQVTQPSDNDSNDGSRKPIPKGLKNPPTCGDYTIGNQRTLPAADDPPPPPEKLLMTMMKQDKKSVLLSSLIFIVRRTE